MIEYPESYAIARQINKELSGRAITSCIRGNSPHRFAFYNLDKEEYEAKIVGKTIGKSSNKHSYILTSVGTQLILALGEGGEKIRLHGKDEELPKKYQLLLGFDDGRHLSVAVSGWGMVSLFTRKEIENHPYLSRVKADPMDKGFTPNKLQEMVEVEEKNPSIKYFLVSEPGISGIGNGMCQEILFEAKIHPKTKIKSLSGTEIDGLHKAITTVVSKACELGGRDNETDIYGNVGAYETRMTAKTAGTPCPNCGTKIEKIAWLGGNCYFCPKCQILK